MYSLTFLVYADPAHWLAQHFSLLIRDNPDGGFSVIFETEADLIAFREILEKLLKP